jgi:hypothetical protein
MHADPRQHAVSRQLPLQRHRGDGRALRGREHPPPVAPAPAADRQQADPPRVRHTTSVILAAVYDTRRPIPVS